MLYWALLALGCGIGVAIAAFGSALGLGRATAAALEGTARQPEAAGNIRTTLIIGGALIEALTIYALLMAILLMMKLPAVEVAEKVIGAMK
jgi:F-type H+-transporting ATPase subunit c